MAGLPQEVIINAERVLKNLESKEKNKDIETSLNTSENIFETNENINKEQNEYSQKPDKEQNQSSNTKKVTDKKDNLNHKVQQLPLFNTENPVIKKIKEKDIVNMTPLDAINFLYNIKQEIKEEGKSHG